MGRRAWGNKVFSVDADTISSNGTRSLFVAARRHGAYDDSFMAEAEANFEAARA